MRPRKLILCTLGALMAVMPGGCAPGAPQTYADCVLQHVRPGMSNVGSIRVYEACREKFRKQYNEGTTAERIWAAATDTTGEQP